MISAVSPQEVRIGPQEIYFASLPGSTVPCEACVKEHTRTRFKGSFCDVA